ncbi:RICIN domain-containing protein [Streptomyces sp. NPDC056987]|uniref:RICIN domain-containing protein n=1 Tax=Streptomyces sp. NPDC056987 TaxID=3345988 RepID=UPI00363F73DB
MHTPHPPRPAYPPRSARPAPGSGAFRGPGEFPAPGEPSAPAPNEPAGPGEYSGPAESVGPGESDARLLTAVRARAGTGDTYPVALLMARHWEAVHAYAAVCLASPEKSASVVAAATFHQVLEALRRVEPSAAIRPQLLVTVREMVGVWSSVEPITELLPELRRPAVRRGARVARSRDTDHRKLALRSFRAMSGTAQCLLWHTEVEAEPISVPAALLALDTDTAHIELEHAREEFRRGCLRAHIEIAPKSECRYYNRLLDVPIRRGGSLLPDVRDHLAECAHCRDAADQLAHFNGKLGVLLAEAVLGWGARRYLDLRAGARAPESGARGSARPVGRHSAPGRQRLLPAFTVLDRVSSLAPVPSRVFFAGLGAGSAVLLATVLAVSLWPARHASDDYGSAASSSASAPYPSPSGSTGANGGGVPPDPSGMATGPQDLRLRNAATDLCLDIRDARIKRGAEATTAACSSAGTQRWSYEDDGLLRSAAKPELCLNSRGVDGIAVLGRCAVRPARGADVRYDLTVQGTLIPRWQDNLAVTPVSGGPGADVVVRPRDGSPEQRWLTDRVTTAAGSRPINGGTPPASPPSPEPSAPSAPSPRPVTEPPESAPQPNQHDPLQDVGESTRGALVR